MHTGTDTNTHTQTQGPTYACYLNESFRWHFHTFRRAIVPNYFETHSWYGLHKSGHTLIHSCNEYTPKCRCGDHILFTASRLDNKPL